MKHTTPPLDVLLIEDEPLIAMDMQMMVEDAGHMVVGEAATMTELETILPGTAPDVAFVDIQLGDGSSGIDACRRIRDTWKDTFVIFVTANPAMIPDDFAGGHGVIAKPFTQDGFMPPCGIWRKGSATRHRSCRVPMPFAPRPPLPRGGRTKFPCHPVPRPAKHP